MPDVIIFADTVRSPELRHEVPVAVPDPFLYVERNGDAHAFVGSMEIPRLQDMDGLEVVPLEEFGLDELVEQGYSLARDDDRARPPRLPRSGVDAAVTPRDFPLERRRPPARERDRGRGPTASSSTSAAG